MAKAPRKRRGITLGPHTDSGASFDLLSAQPATSVSPPRDHPQGATGARDSDPDVVLAASVEQLAELRRMNTDLDTRLQRQAGRLQQQRRQLEEQQDQIALQTRQLQELEGSRQTAGRLGVLLALLAVAGVAALGYHTWPQVQEIARDLNRVSAGVRDLAPQLQAVRGQVNALTSHAGQMGSTMASLRKDISGMHSDLGTLHRSIDALQANEGMLQASASGARGAVRTPSRQARIASHPYWAMRPPW